TEGLPDLGAQLAPAVDLGADLPHPRLPAVDDLLLLHDAHAELVQRRALSAQCEVVRVDDGDGGGHRQEESQHRQDEPPRQGQPGDASPVPVDHQEIELAPRQHHSQRLIGTTERSRVGSPSVLGFTLFIRQWPSNITPSSTPPTTGASTSPKTRAARLSSTRSAAETLPTTSPLMSTCPARMFPFMTPLSPMINMSVDEISPLNRPFSMTVPLNVYRPSISEPSPMKAVRPLRLMG